LSFGKHKFIILHIITSFLDSTQLYVVGMTSAQTENTLPEYYLTSEYWTWYLLWPLAEQSRPLILFWETLPNLATITLLHQNQVLNKTYVAVAVQICMWLEFHQFIGKDLFRH